MALLDRLFFRQSLNEIRFALLLFETVEKYTQLVGVSSERGSDKIQVDARSRAVSLGTLLICANDKPGPAGDPRGVRAQARGQLSGVPRIAEPGAGARVAPGAASNRKGAGTGNEP